MKQRETQNNETQKTLIELLNGSLWRCGVGGFVVCRCVVVSLIIVSFASYVVYVVVSYISFHVSLYVTT